jgi:hypothetical protein
MLQKTLENTEGAMKKKGHSRETASKTKKKKEKQIATAKKYEIIRADTRYCPLCVNAHMN